MPKDILDTIKGDFTPVGIQMKPGTGKLSESEKATKKKYREANREDILQKKKEYRDTHKEVIKASQKA